MIRCIPWPITPRKRGRPYVYFPQTVILSCFIVRMWSRIDSNNALHTFLKLNSPYNCKLAIDGGLGTILDRCTFDRRLKTISADIKYKIATMGYLFLTEELVVDHSITQQ